MKTKFQIKNGRRLQKGKRPITMRLYYMDPHASITATAFYKEFVPRLRKDDDGWWVWRAINESVGPFRTKRAARGYYRREELRKKKLYGNRN